VTRGLLACALLGCGSAAPVATPAAPPPPPPIAPIPVEDENARRSELAAAHHELEDEQATAFAATCDKPAHTDKRCTPSCYAGEPADVRAGKTLHRSVEIVHHVCTADAGNAGPFVIADELGGELRPARGRVPAAAKQGSWQADVEIAVGAALKPELARGDVVRVTSGWRPVTHPITAEHWRCVTAVHYARSLRRPLDGCGAQGQVACEATGNAAAHGINVVHYRLAEARRLHASNDEPGCQAAALEAVAVARGLPRWRQYATLNTTKWKASARYRTRFDGVLDEDTLFTTAIALGTDAEAVYASCGGAGTPKTTAAQEQSFHTCW
jgi:hypothetical protein